VAHFGCREFPDIITDFTPDDVPDILSCRLAKGGLRLTQYQSATKLQQSKKIVILAPP
jgi:hypothetical protein